MKTIFTLFIVPTLVCLLSFNAYAQESRPPRPGAGQEEFRGKAPRSAKERAESRTQEMDKAVNLDEKQYKKIYRIFLKEENAKDSAMGNGGPMGPPPAGSEGRPPQGGGSFGAPRMGGPGAGGPPVGRMNSDQMPPRGGFPGDGPQKVTVGGKDIDSDEYIDEREAKFKKILSPEQYSTWRRLHPDPTGFFHK